MTLSSLDHLRVFKPSILLDSVVSRRWRKRLKQFFGLLAAACFIASVFGPNQLFDGLALIFFAVFLIFLSLEFFYNSSRFGVGEVEYSVVLALFGIAEDDVTQNFFLSPAGKILFFRLGFSALETKRFLDSERKHISLHDLHFDTQSMLSFDDYTETLYRADLDLENFIATKGLNKEEFLGAATWIGKELSLEMNKERWWSSENLGSFPSLGTGLDYGSSSLLSDYTIPLEYGVDLLSLNLEDGYRAKEVSQLENILSRSEEANALLVDDEEGVVRDILLRLLKKIRIGTAPANLEHTHIVRLDWNTLVSTHANKAGLEREILSLLETSRKVGNIILYISNLPEFMMSVSIRGVNLASLLEECMKSKDLHVIGHSTKQNFHYFVENNSALLRMFERIIPDSLGVEASLSPLLEKARRLESQNNLFFSYPALKAIAESAARYIAYGEMPQKAIDLLVEITPWALKNQIDVVVKKDVAVFVSQKTGVALGDVSKEEGEKLSHLEAMLYERIVGQHKALQAIAKALRRSRSGLSNPKRPVASFLFLGPTGVGKTETSKALAESFFGGEDKIIRFDMSQYKEADALPLLIGSFSEHKPGILSSKLRDNPYGVLLLDEFEKASPDVRDVFLQILDEGEYMDALGAPVNCRNLIIIATSNAGSSLIWKLVQGKQDLNAHKQEIIHTLIEERVYKSELINRFDEVVIFHPLQPKDLP